MNYLGIASYVFGLLSAAALTSFEGVMAFQDHEMCFSEKGSNVTMSFDIAFRMGFYICALDLLITAFVELYVLLMKYYDLNKQGYFSNKTENLDFVYMIVKWLVRVLLLLIAFFQLAILSFDKSSRYCILEVETLKEEGQWLQWLCIAKIIKVLLLSLVDLCARDEEDQHRKFADKQYDLYRMEQKPDKEDPETCDNEAFNKWAA